MAQPSALPADSERLDRHALVMAIWLPAGFVAAAFLHLGLDGGPIAALVCAFASVLAAFAGHVIVNVVTRTAFTARELGLGLVLYLAALLAFGLTALLDPALWAGRHWIAGSGFVVLAAAVAFHLVTARGVRGAFEEFDVIRSFRAARPDADRRRR